MPGSATLDPDSAVRATDSDASHSRLSAVKKSYIDDPFIQFFIPLRARGVQGRPPLINIGTTIRGEGVDRLAASWLMLGEGPKQIVTLGAGSDTRFWRFMQIPHLRSRIAKYLEVDFPEITTRKAMAIKKHPELCSVLGDASQVKLTGGGTGLTSPIYTLHALDLRSPPETNFVPLFQPLSETSTPPLDPSLPVLFLAECVFVYLPPTATHALISFFTSAFRTPGCAAVVYEMFGLADAFGRIMKENLRSRGVEIPGVIESKEMQSQAGRLVQGGMADGKAVTLKTFRERGIDAREMARLSSLELLDEIEELDLMLSHYVISWGCLPPEDIDEECKKAWLDWDLSKNNWKEPPS